MATQLISLALIFSLFMSQVLSHPRKNEETGHQVFSSGGDKNFGLDISEYLEDPSISNDLDLALAPALAPAPGPGPRQLDCGELCEHRCSVHSRQKICLRACGTCCERCKCVPPGTFGNREMCGKCYTEMTTHGNKPKCP